MARFNEEDDEFDSENILERIARTTTNQGKAHELMRAGRDVVHRDASKSMVFYETALDLFVENGDMTGAAYAAIAIGFAHCHRRSWSEAAVAYGQAIDFGRAASRSDLEIDCTFFKGRCHRNNEDIVEAANLMGQALAIATEVSYPFQMIIRLEYGRLLRKMGRNEDALTVLEPAIAEARDNDPGNFLPSLTNEKAIALRNLRRYQDGLDLATESNALSTYFEAEGEIERSKYLMAELLIELGREAEALPLLEQVKEFENALRERKHQLKVDHLYAKALSGVGRTEEARELLLVLIPLMDSLKLAANAAAAVADLSITYFAEGNSLDAQANLEKALIRARALSDVVLETSIYLSLGIIAYETGDWAQVAEMNRVVLDSPFANTQYWFAGAQADRAVALAKLEQFADAAALAKSAIKLAKPAKDARTLARANYALLLAGKAAEVQPKLKPIATQVVVNALASQQIDLAQEVSAEFLG
jgi:tetratricopeptide (TPR) repeat protein